MTKGKFYPERARRDMFYRMLGKHIVEQVLNQEIELEEGEDAVLVRINIAVNRNILEQMKHYYNA